MDKQALCPKCKQLVKLQPTVSIDYHLLQCFNMVTKGEGKLKRSTTCGYRGFIKADHV